MTKLVVKDAFWGTLWLAIGLWMIWGGFQVAYRTYHHHGGGAIAVFVGSRETRDAVDEEWVSERRYKRDGYVGTATLGIFGLLSCYTGIPYWKNRGKPVQT